MVLPPCRPRQTPGFAKRLRSALALTERGDHREGGGKVGSPTWGDPDRSAALSDENWPGKTLSLSVGEQRTVGDAQRWQVEDGSQVQCQAGAARRIGAGGVDQQQVRKD